MGVKPESALALPTSRVTLRHYKIKMGHTFRLFWLLQLLMQRSRQCNALNNIATALRHLMSWDSICTHVIGKQDTPAAEEYPVASAVCAWVAAASGTVGAFKAAQGS